MVVSNYPDILQEKMNEIFRVFEFIQAYINDLLIIANGDQSDHLEKWNEQSKILKTVGLIVIQKSHSLEKLIRNI